MTLIFACIHLSLGDSKRYQQYFNTPIERQIDAAFQRNNIFIVKIAAKMHYWHEQLCTLSKMQQAHLVIPYICEC
jgi:hypothetical protein